MDKARVVKMMKCLRIYLHHIQESVFVGELSPKTYRSLCDSIRNLMDPTYDRVIIYKMNSIKSMTVKVFGEQKWIENVL